ncbi:uncharacterized protein LOC112139172 [Oryzias melastigma]|uniref:uncharacterized protein LOC112139172 n=1 Tax=Oryzias melastigma TaxID=30732 RepID=UPI000CF8038E|nr:uncharacterized protein LOC112139172 [Oryzias melastigma]
MELVQSPRGTGVDQRQRDSWPEFKLFCPSYRSLEPAISCLSPVIGVDNLSISRPPCSPRPRQRGVNLRNLRPLRREACVRTRRSRPAGDSVGRLRVGLLNARSITNKTFYLNDSFSSEHLDFLCLTETWQQETVHIHINELCPPDCSVLSTPRSSGRLGGGLALIHRDIFPCRNLRPDCFSSFELQITKVGFDQPFYLILVYRPPGPARVFLDEFSEFLSSIIPLQSVLLLGDFNFHIDNSACMFGSELLFLTQSFNFTQHVSGPTRDKGHTLDLFFSFGLNIEQLCVRDSHVSDHCWIFFNVKFPLSPLSSPLGAQHRLWSNFLPVTMNDIRSLLNKIKPSS